MNRSDHITAEQLSAFFDGELTPGDAAIVERHVAECTECLEELSAMERTRRAMHMLPTPPASENLWDRIEGALPKKAPLIPLFTQPVQRWAVAAALLVAVAIGTLVVNPLGLVPEIGPFASHSEEAASFGFDYGLYLAALTEPDRMEQFEARYKPAKASLRDALAAVGIPVGEGSLGAVPEGFELKSVYVLSDASTKSMQMTYRHKGSEITVFRQPKGYPIQFAGYQLEPVVIGGKQCLMAHDGNYCAITIATEKTQHVIIGHRDDVMVAQLIDDIVVE